MAAIDELRRHAQELFDATGVTTTLVENGTQIYVILNKVRLPTGAYAVDATDILFITDQQYPLSAMDMFWTELAVLLPNGSEPANASSLENYANRQWRRFSWHRNGTWNHNGNPLLDHFEFTQHRFAQDVSR